MWLMLSVWLMRDVWGAYDRKHWREAAVMGRGRRVTGCGVRSERVGMWLMVSDVVGACG
jgi:hypothetical protein